MAQKVNQKIKDNFKYYNKLVIGNKTIKKSPITLNQDANNKSYKQKSVEVEHISEQEEIAFVVEMKKNDSKNFKFKLRAKDFTGNPLFRFDSDGDTHKNSIPGIPLEKQQITTPHFHKFHESGKEIAYKTEHLERVETAIALQDINLCAAHFCHEANLRLNKDEFPKIESHPNQFDFDKENDDPHNNISF
jgi:hypothetical protein